MFTSVPGHLAPGARDGSTTECPDQDSGSTVQMLIGAPKMLSTARMPTISSTWAPQPGHLAHPLRSRARIDAVPHERDLRETRGSRIAQVGPHDSRRLPRLPRPEPRRLPRTERGARQRRRARRLAPELRGAPHPGRPDPRRGVGQRDHPGLAPGRHRRLRDRDEPVLVGAHLGLPGAQLFRLRRRTRGGGRGGRSLFAPSGRARHVPVRLGDVHRHALAATGAASSPSRATWRPP